MTLIYPQIKFTTIDELNKLIRINLFVKKIFNDSYLIQIYDSRKRYFEKKINKETLKYYLKLYQSKQLNIYYSFNDIKKLCVYLNYNDYAKKINSIDELYYFEDNLIMIEKEIMITSEALQIYCDMIEKKVNVINENLIKEKIETYKLELENLIEKKNYLIKFYPIENENKNKNQNININQNINQSSSTIYTKKCSKTCQTHVIQSYYDCALRNKIKCLVCGECWKCIKCLDLIKSNDSNNTIICTECWKNVSVYFKYK
jgi:hypothetical protein